MSTSGDMGSRERPICIPSDDENNEDGDCMINEAATAETQPQARRDLPMDIVLVELKEGDQRLERNAAFAIEQAATREETPEEMKARDARPPWVDPLDYAQVKELFRATRTEDWQTDKTEFATRVGMSWTRYLGALFNMDGQLKQMTMLPTDSIYAALTLCLGDLATDTILVATSLVLNGDLKAERANENIRDRAAFDGRRFHVYAVVWQTKTRHWAVAVVDMHRTSPRCYYIDTWKEGRRERMVKLRKGAFRAYFSSWGCPTAWLDTMKWYRVGCKQQDETWECGLLSIETARVMLREKTGMAASPDEWAGAGWQHSRLVKTPSPAGNGEKALVTAWLSAIRWQFDTTRPLRAGRPKNHPASEDGCPATPFRVVKKMKDEDTKTLNWKHDHMTRGPAEAQGFVDEQAGMDWDEFEKQTSKQGGQKENEQPRQKKPRG